MKTLKRLILFIASGLLLLFPHDINSCGFMIMEEEYRFWAFDQQLGKAPGLLPYLYSSDLHYHDSWWYYDDEEDMWDPLVENEQNITDWYNRLNGKATRNDISTILYSYSPRDFFDAYVLLRRENTFIQAIDNDKVLKEYLEFAKTTEQLCSYDDPWDCNDCPEIRNGKVVFPDQHKRYMYMGDMTPDMQKMDKAMAKGERMIAHCTEPFLKERIALQLTRLAYYAFDPVAVKKYYDQYLAPLDDTRWIKYSALLYTILNYEGAQREYVLSRVFDKCPDKRFRCMQLFDSKNFEAALSFTQNDHERAVLNIMRCIHDPAPAMDRIREIYRLDPGNSLLNLVLVREVNKIEDWVLTPKYTEFAPTTDNEYWSEYDDSKPARNHEEDMEYINTLRIFMERIIAEHPEANKNFVHLIAGYLAFMHQQFAIAASHYNAIQKAKLTPRARVQLSMSKVMLQLSRTSRITSQTDQMLADCIAELSKAGKTIMKDTTIKDQLILFAANEYMRRGARAKGLMLYGQTNRIWGYTELPSVKDAYSMIYDHAVPADYDSILAIISRENKPDFEQWLMTKGIGSFVFYDKASDTLEWNKNKILDLKSMWYMKHDDLINAYKTVVLIDTAYWSKWPYDMFVNDDPFNVNPWNPHYAYNLKNRRYNKATYIQELINLKVAIAKASGNKKAKLYFRLANGYLSMTHDGKYWIMQHIYNTYNENNERKRTPFEKAYYQCARAEYYYRQAMRHTTDPEFAALCGVFLQQTIPGITEKDAERMFAQRSKSAEYYNLLSTNCMMLEDYIGKLY